jgi:antitoxin MazE5
MTRVRLSTTVDEQLLEGARRVHEGKPDSIVIDDALAALLARNRSAQVDVAYAAYDEHPLDEQDEWGDLAAFREAAGAS